MCSGFQIHNFNRPQSVSDDVFQLVGSLFTSNWQNSCPVVYSFMNCGCEWGEGGGVGVTYSNNVIEEGLG